LIAVIVVLAALKAATPIVAPFVLALFLIAVFWPVQRFFQRRFPRSVSIGLTLLIFLGIAGLMLAALWYSSLSLIQKWPRYAQSIDHYRALAADYGVPVPTLGDEAGIQQWLVASDLGQEALFEMSGALALVGAGFTLVIAYLIMGLLEVDVFDEKLDQILPGYSDLHWLNVAATIAADCRRYLLVRTAISLLSGILVGVAAWLIGLDFAFIWGLLTFLLKYVPTLGSLVIVLLPTFFALLQFGDWRQALLTLLVIGSLQALQGNILNPLLQSRYLSPSPLMIVFSVVFWGWLWGTIGAFLAVPLTVLLIVTCRQFQRTRWIATLLAHWDENSDEKETVSPG
jgi:AI-2 transport protein TqsA